MKSLAESSRYYICKAGKNHEEAQQSDELVHRCRFNALETTV